MNNLLFLPHYVFLTGSLLKERDTLPIYLFTGLVIDRLFYNLPFINTIILLFFFLFSLYFKNIKGKRGTLLKNIFFTSSYFLVFMIYLKKELFLIYFISLFWNVLITYFMLLKRRLLWAVVCFFFYCYI